MADYAEVAKLDELPPGTGTSVEVQGKAVAVFNVDGTIYAIADACLHRGMPLGVGALEGDVIRCRAHGWRYDVKTGAVVGVPGMSLATYSAKVEKGKIWVSVG